MDRLQDFYHSHFQSCRYGGDEGAYEAAFAGEIGMFVQQLSARWEGEDVERAWRAPDVHEFVAALRKCCKKAQGCDGWKAEE
eukprot:8619276-Alexandrium_andersonii.AAC.1